MEQSGPDQTDSVFTQPVPGDSVSGELHSTDPVSGDSVTVGWISSLHGISGEVLVRLFSDVPHRFDPKTILYLNDSPLQIESSNINRTRQAIIKFDGIDSPEAAQNLLSQWLTIPKDTVAELPEGEYFHFQLLGLRVITDENEELGRVTEVIETGSNDVYVVDGAG
ncbi:MAG: 16S rRNA processing protein RimM [Chloroflexi bacterium]|nr:16S rRNA processing protein RimM [Chloroflexota bacterium]